MNELQARFAEVVGEKTRSPNKTFLIRKITEALQAKAPTGATSPAAKAATLSAGKAGGPATEKLTRFDVSELQARYLEAVGRPTGAANKAYLIWKIREAKQGRIPVGPRTNAHREGITFKILPLRMEAAVVDKMDEAWRSRGIKNRTEFFRGALGHHLKHLGAEDAAVWAALISAVEAKQKVIPVLLPSARATPTLPFVLGALQRIDFRDGESDGIEKLVAAVTREKQPP